MHERTIRAPQCALVGRHLPATGHEQEFRAFVAAAYARRGLAATPSAAPSRPSPCAAAAPATGSVRPGSATARSAHPSRPAAASLLSV